MQTTVHSLSVRSFVTKSIRLLIALSIAFVLLFTAAYIKPSAEKLSLEKQAHQNFTPIVNKMIDMTNRNRKSKTEHSQNLPSDTSQFKQTDWYKTVQEDVARRMYNINSGKTENIFQSINNEQSLETVYTLNTFSLRPLIFDVKKQTPKDNWQLNISLKSLYADEKLLSTFTDASNSVADNNVEYDFGNSFAIQYHNDRKGIRQNFIVKEKPAGNVRQLEIKMHADGDWVVNKVHDKELHFAKKNSRESLENKITYNDLKVWDAQGKILSAKMETADNNDFEIIADVSKATFPVTIDPLSSSASTTLTGGTGTGTFGNSVASAGDVNGDGYTDVIVGDANDKEAFVYLGSASGLSSSPVITLSGSTNFGVSVAGAGDVNGDGLSDVIVGDASGHAYIYFGTSGGTGVASSPSVTLSVTGLIFFGLSVASAGDVNGDGYSDVIVGDGVGDAILYVGAATTGPSPASPISLTGSGIHFGASVASAGDINADGYADVVVGNAGGDAFVYLGSASGISTTASVTLSETGAGAHYGVSVSSAADVNGDGYSDVIVGDAGGDAYVYFGGTSGVSSPANITLTVSSSPNFGTSVAGAGDVNGDAYADVIVGDANGNAFVFNGSFSGTSTTATYTLTNSSNFGISVASSGDVNGDGYSDVIVGSTTSMSAYVYNGSPNGSVSTNTLSISGQQAGDRYALSVSSAGDINGDGYSDVIVGAIGYSGGALNGAAYIYLGSSTGLSTSSPTILTPGTQEVGWDVAAAGDIDGDGYDDILIGAKFTTGSGGDNQGAVYVYRGNSTGVPTLAQTLSGLNGGDVYGFSVSSAGDINGDGYSDIIIGAPAVSTTNSFGGAAYIYMGGVYDNASTSFPSFSTPIALNGAAANAVFGSSVANAGDVNGDGYSDVIVGAPNLGGAYDVQDLGTGTNTGSGLGSAYVFYGSKTGIANNASPNVALSDNSTVDFGISVASAGDVNGDGFDDVIVGASSGDNTGNPGTAEVFLGASGGLSTTAANVLNGLSAGDEFGTTVASAGDVNGDGYSDIIIRATMPSSSNQNTGAAYIFLGSPTGLSSTIATTFSDEGSNTYLETPGGGAAGNIMHRSVASAGDVNGDGYSDVIVGTYTDDTHGTKTGKAYFYYGNNSVGRNASNVLRLYETDLTNPIAADNLSQSNFGLGLFVQSPFGYVKGRMVWETEPNGTAFHPYPSQITNSTFYTQGQSADAPISVGGTEFKNLISKTAGKATKVRVRIKYTPNAVTFGQVFSPWIYSQVYLLGGDIGVLPLSVILSANPSGQNIIVNWKASDENNLNDYVVMHSLDGINFDSLGEVAAKNNIGTSQYSFTHFTPGIGLHYYRLKIVDESGHYTNSQIVSARLNGDVEFNISPNPASDHILVTYTGITSSYLRIINSGGSIVGQYQLDPNSSQITIPLSGFAKGNYYVELVNSGFTPKQISVQ